MFSAFQASVHLAQNSPDNLVYYKNLSTNTLRDNSRSSAERVRKDVGECSVWTRSPPKRTMHIKVTHDKKAIVDFDPLFGQNWRQF